VCRDAQTVQTENEQLRKDLNTARGEAQQLAAAIEQLEVKDVSHALLRGSVDLHESLEFCVWFAPFGLMFDSELAAGCCRWRFRSWRPSWLSKNHTPRWITQRSNLFDLDWTLSWQLAQAEIENMKMDMDKTKFNQ
jgi:hypothetical protein